MTAKCLVAILVPQVVTWVHPARHPRNFRKSHSTYRGPGLDEQGSARVPCGVRKSANFVKGVHLSIVRTRYLRDLAGVLDCNIAKQQKGGWPDLDCRAHAYVRCRDVAVG